MVCNRAEHHFFGSLATAVSLHIKTGQALPKTHLNRSHTKTDMKWSFEHKLFFFVNFLAHQVQRHFMMWNSVTTKSMSKTHCSSGVEKISLFPCAPPEYFVVVQASFIYFLLSMCTLNDLKCDYSELSIRQMIIIGPFFVFFGFFGETHTNCHKLSFTFLLTGRCFIVPMVRNSQHTINSIKGFVRNFNENWLLPYLFCTCGFSWLFHAVTNAFPLTACSLSKAIFIVHDIMRTINFFQFLSHFALTFYFSVSKITGLAIKCYFGIWCTAEKAIKIKCSH